MRRILSLKKGEIKRAKAEAGRRIGLFMPLWKQHNELVRAHFLLSKRVDFLLSKGGFDDPLTAKEKAALDAAELRLRQVQKMAKHGNQLEKNISDGIPTDLDAGWDEL